jgi:hypothetical protein
MPLVVGSQEGKKDELLVEKHACTYQPWKALLTTRVIGWQVSVVGEMTAAAIGHGDVLLLSAGPGYFSTAAALAKEAQRAGEWLCGARIEEHTRERVSMGSCLTQAAPLRVVAL